MGVNYESQTATLPQVETRPRQTPLWHVVLLDDDEHTYEYVIEMLHRLFGMPLESAYLKACEVDGSGRAIVETTVLERAEFKRDQIHAFGRDWRLSRSRGPMRAILQPVEQRPD